MWHNWLIAWERKKVVMRFMNYGYAPIEGETEMFPLSTDDEPERFCTQLYHYAVSHIELKDKDVLEVGRGGGASYISRYLVPQSYIALDLSVKGIEFCNDFYSSSNLRFVRGEAETLPFDDQHFDAVVNVESSRVYTGIEHFFREVFRVLKPGDAFLLTDMRPRHQIEQLHRQVQEAGFLVQNMKTLPIM